MYKSLKKWLKVPFSIRPFVRYSGSGDKEYGTAIAAYCYAEGRAILVKNAVGNQAVSQRQLYVDSDLVIQLTEGVIFEGKEYEVQAISPFYDEHGNTAIKVVYV